MLSEIGSCTEHIGNIKVLSSISSIWKDDHIQRLENNQWKCLWSKFVFQGINDTKDIVHVIGTKCMHINICRDSTNQARLSRYKYLQLIKASEKGLINGYSRKIISSVSSLQDNSSAVVESNIQRNPMGVSSRNLIA